jgi:hypothetical protein
MEEEDYLNVRGRVTRFVRGHFDIHYYWQRAHVSVLIALLYSNNNGLPCGYL